jgi:hypothetical protein
MMRSVLYAATPLMVVALAGCDNTFDDAVKNPSAETVRQYVEKGWLPHGVPQNISAVKVSGDTDAERSVGVFSSEGMDAYLAKCTTVTDGFAIEGGLPKWFPQELRDARSSDELRHEGYTTYICEDDFAVLRKGTDKTAWFWSDREDDD